MYAFGPHTILFLYIVLLLGTFRNLMALLYQLPVSIVDSAQHRTKTSTSPALGEKPSTMQRPFIGTKN